MKAMQPLKVAPATSKMVSSMLSLFVILSMTTTNEAIPHKVFSGTSGGSNKTSSSDEWATITNPSFRDDFGGPFFDPHFFDPIPTESGNTKPTEAPTKTPSKVPPTFAPNSTVPTVAHQTIADIACNTEGFETLCEFVFQAGLESLLDDPDQSLTVFAPTNKAFEEIAESILSGMTVEEIEFVLLYHATAGKMPAKDLICDKDLVMANDLATTIICKKDGGLFIVGTGNEPLRYPQIITKDIQAKNGIIHAINKVILPATLPPVPTPTPDATKTPTYKPTVEATKSPTNAPVHPPTLSPTKVPTVTPTETPTAYVPKCKNVAELACETEGFEILCKLLKSTGLDYALADPYQEFTLFAPTNSALEKIQDAFAAVTREEAAYALLYHVVNGIVFSNDLVCAPESGSRVEMANGMSTTTKCSDDGKVFQVGTGNTGQYWPRIIAVDMQACNGVVHAVNNVILPGAAPHPPTHKPTVAPTFHPTYKPVPQPVHPPSHEPTVAPTFHPTYKPVPQPVHPPSHEPTVAPTFQPTYKPIPPPAHPPVTLAHPPVSPPAHPQQPVRPPTPSPVHPPTFSPGSGRKPTEMKNPILTARYDAIWGISKDKCGYMSPNVFLHCEQGGILNIEEAVNTICRQLSDDYYQCRQPDDSEEAFVKFTCSGIQQKQLKAVTNIGPSPAWDCSTGGRAIKYLTLQRYCFTGDGNVFTESGKCVDGEAWTPPGADSEYCASAGECLENKCERLAVASVTTAHNTSPEECSFVNDQIDLQGSEFKPSSLSSLNLVDWRFSGQGRGCSWQPPSLSLRCDNGGKLGFLEDYEFCRQLPEDNMAVCDNFAPFSTNNEEVMGLLVSCTGQNEEQLILTVELPSAPLEVNCVAQGVALQSVSLGRACGEYETEEFSFTNDPFFCESEDQIFQIDSFRSYCFAGDSCTLANGCNTLQLPSISANTDEDVVGYCVYAV